MEEIDEKLKKLIATKDITNIKLAYIIGSNSKIINEYKKAIYFYKDFIHVFDLHGHKGEVYKTNEELIFLFVNLKKLDLNRITILHNNKKYKNSYFTSQLKRLPYLHLFLNLRVIHASDHKIKKVDVSNNLLLVDINLANNKLIEINVSKNLNLRQIDIQNNNITYLDLTNNKKIKTYYYNIKKVKVKKNENTIIDDTIWY
jgi:hypothetical protein